MVVVDLGGVLHPHLGHVDAICRFRLQARRHGWIVRVANVGGDLQALMAFCGLPLETSGQTEGREQLGVQEVVQPRDPSV